MGLIKDQPAPTSITQEYPDDRGITFIGRATGVPAKPYTWDIKSANDAENPGEVLDVAQDYTTESLIRYTVPTFGGPFVTGAPQSATLAGGTDVLVRPLASIPANTLSNPLTIADLLLMKAVDVDPESGSELVSIAARLGINLSDPDWGDRQGTNYDNVPTLTAILDQIITALENLNVTGQPVTPYAATFATLTPVPADTDGDTTKYWTVLTTDDIGTGDEANPQYPAGIYLTGLNQAAGWNFGASLGGEVDLGQYVHVTVAGSELEINKRHRLNGIDVVAPSAPVIDDWFSVYNQIPLLGGVDSTITGGNFRFVTNASVIPQTGVTPGKEVQFVYDGTNWLQIDLGELLVSMSDADTGQVLQRKFVQKIHSTVDTSEFFLPPGPPFGVVRVMLSANSDGSFKISQHATTTGSTIAFEDGTVHSDFMLPNSGRGQVVRFYGDGLNWNLVRPYIVKAKGAVVWHTAETDVPIVDAKNIYPLGTNLGLVPQPTHIEGARYSIETGDLATELLEGNAHGYLSNGIVGAGGKWIREATAASHILDKITIALRSAGTNASSNVDITIADADGTVYPPSEFLASGTFDQYTGGTEQIVLDRVPFTGRIGLGRNKEGTLELEHIGDLPNGLSAVTIVGNSGGQSDGAISVLYKGTNYNDSWPNKTSVETVYWTTVQTAPEASDQAAYWESNKEYLVGDVLSHTEQDATTPDPNVGELFNWRVTTQIDANEFATWDGTNYAAIQGKLTRFAIGAVDTGLPVEQRADNESSVVGKTNLRYQDDTIGAVPAVVLGQEYADSTVPVNRGDTPGPGIEATSIVYLGADIGNGPEWVVVKGSSGAVKNALVFPVGNFTALAVNDSGEGDDGAVYRLPNIDALVVTLPNKADMNAAEGIYRTRISGDWAALSAQPTVLSFTHDATTVEFSDGLPTDSDEWVDIIFDAANDKWIATSGGEVTLNQIIGEYQNHADVPANVRMYLLDGTGVGAVGLWRKEPVTDSPNFVG